MTTDHLSSYTIILKQKADVINRPMIRLFNKSNKENFQKSLAKTDWNDIYSKKNADKAYSTFIAKIQKLFNEHFPLTKLSRARQKDKKWITPALRKSSKHKNNLYNIWLRTKDKKDEENYKKYTRVFKMLAKRAEVAYYQHMFDDKTNTVKKLWHNLNKVCSFKRNKSKKTTVAELMVDNNKLVITVI